MNAKGTTLLAVSGGVDSTVMADLFYKTVLPFAIAHCNFKLRGKESDADEVFVKQLATRYQVPYYSTTFDTATYAQAHKASIQMAARTLRYAWFYKLLKQHGLQRLATAHHKDDHAETLLLNFIRGTGITGLSGILPKKGRLIRPLRFATKSEIWKYAKDANLSWRDDNSNQKVYYQRNWIRHRIIPLLKPLNGCLAQTLSTTSIKLQQVAFVYHAHVASIKQQALQHNPPDYYLKLAPLKDQPWASIVAYDLLLPFGFNFSQIHNLWQQQPQSGRILLSTTHRLVVDRHRWIISPRTAPSAATGHKHVLTTTTEVLNMPGFDLRAKKCDYKGYKLSKNKHTAALDLDKLCFPLRIRTWRQGDAFYPLGMQHKKKISDFLIDAKISLQHKDSIYLITSLEAIVWIVGHRIDDRFKLTAATKRVYELHQVVKESKTTNAADQKK